MSIYDDGEIPSYLWMTIASFYRIFGGVHAVDKKVTTVTIQCEHAHCGWQTVQANANQLDLANWLVLALEHERKFHLTPPVSEPVSEPSLQVS